MIFQNGFGSSKEVASHREPEPKPFLEKPEPCQRSPMSLFVSAFRSFWPPKAAADCQTLSFLASLYKIRLSKNYSKSI
jgi:hypothetical protein